MFNKLFLVDTAERVIVTFAEALLALLLVTPHTPILAFDWPSAIGLSLTAAAISALKAIVATVAKKDAVSPASLAPNDRGI